MKKYLHIFVSSLMAGFLITIGASVYISTLVMGASNPESAQLLKLAGSLLFGFGLFIIIHFGFWLYTGKVGNVLANKPSYFLDLLVCVTGNMLGVFLLSSLLKATRMVSPEFINQATAIVNAKQNDSWYSILILAIMCGVMIYLAVKGHEKCPYTGGKMAIAFLAIVVFILCSFEHCVANVAYYTFAGIFSWKAVLYFLLMIVGNAIGSIAYDGIIRIVDKLKN